MSQSKQEVALIHISPYQSIQS